MSRLKFLSFTKKLVAGLLVNLSLVTLVCAQYGQADVDRVNAVTERLNNLSQTIPELNQKVRLNVSDVSIQEFLRALAQTNKLNLSIDPALNFKIYNNFTNETAKNILIFLAKEYNLQITNVGSIISITRMLVPAPVIAQKIFTVEYDRLKDELSVELNNDSLVAVAKRITSLSQVNIIVPNTLISKQISGFLSKAPIGSGLEKLAYANGLKLVKTADQVYIFQALEENEELYINNQKNTSVRKSIKPFAGQNVQNLNIESRLSNGVTLVSADAANVSILDLLKAAAQETNINYFLYSEIRGNISMRVLDISFDDLLTAMFQNTDYTFRNDHGVYLIGERKSEGLRSSRIIQLQNRSLDTIQNMIPTEWKRGVEIKEFREQNTILLSGSSPQVNEIADFIKKLDKLVPMVLIEVTMIDIRKGKMVKTGISAGVDTVSTGGTVFPGLDYTFGSKSINRFLSSLGRNNSVNLGRVTPNFYVTLSALETNSNVEVRSVPKLSTLNGHSASLSIGSTRYYSTTTQNVIPSLTTQTVVTQQFTAVEANLDIDIKPVVSGDNQITLNIKVDISDFVGDPPLNAPPPTSTSKFESIVRAKNEDMIVLGGIERTESSETGSGVPLLSRIPILKWLFSSKSKGTSKVVTVVFIKPTIIY